jgi:hypothetical protein
MLSLSDQKRADHGWVGCLLDLFLKIWNISFVQFPMSQKAHYTKLEKQRSEESQDDDNEVLVHSDKRRYSLQCNLGQFKPQEIIVSVFVQNKFSFKNQQLSCNSGAHRRRCRSTIREHPRRTRQTLGHCICICC